MQDSFGGSTHTSSLYLADRDVVGRYRFYTYFLINKLITEIMLPW